MYVSPRECWQPVIVGNQCKQAKPHVRVFGRKTPSVGSKQIIKRELGPPSRIWVSQLKSIIIFLSCCIIMGFCDGCVPPVSEDQGPQGGAIRGLPAEIIEMTSITCTAWRHAARALSTLPGHYCIRIEWWTNPVVT